MIVCDLRGLKSLLAGSFVIASWLRKGALDGTFAWSGFDNATCGLRTSGSYLPAYCLRRATDGFAEDGGLAHAVNMEESVHTIPCPSFVVGWFVAVVRATWGSEADLPMGIALAELFSSPLWHASSRDMRVAGWAVVASCRLPSNPSSRTCCAGTSGLIVVEMDGTETGAMDTDMGGLSSAEVCC